MGERADPVDQISLNSSKGEEGSGRGRGREVERGEGRRERGEEGNEVERRGGEGKTLALHMANLCSIFSTLMRSPETHPESSLSTVWCGLQTK